MSQYLSDAVFIAKKAGSLLRENLERDVHIEFKGDIDLVTEMDKKSEKMITRYLEEQFPRHNIIAEEGGGVDRGSEFVWYIDPLDGTSNYAYHVPWFAVSIGLHKDGEPIVGVIYHPVNDELFTAEVGKGAFLNGKSLSVSHRDKVEDSLFVTGFPYYIKKKPHRVLENFKRFLLNSRGIRRYGAAAIDLAYVASGKYDGFWEEGLKPWDTGAGILLVREAGGNVTDYHGKRYTVFCDTMVASNGKIHNEMLKMITV